MSLRRLAIIGDGKMGTAIRDLAVAKGFDVTAFIGERDSKAGAGLDKTTFGGAQVAVEFTEPSAAVANVIATLRAGIPVVVGTTGWYDRLAEVTRVATESGTAL